EVLVHDPIASVEETRHEYGLELVPLEQVGTVDAVVWAVSHDAFSFITLDKLVRMTTNGNGAGVVIDVKTVLKREDVESRGLIYWSL
ncbi:MAG: UDP binding domain-containing protein, partial [Desulfobulbus sp.]